MLLSNKLRLVIRPSLKNITAQIIEYHPKGDQVVVSTSTRELEKLGWKFNTGNVPSAYLAGLAVAKKAIKAGIKEAILDIGLRKPVKGSRVFACLKGAVDGGLEIPHSKEILPSEERIKGEHIIKYAEIQKKDSKEFAKSFEILKNKILKE